MCITVQVQPDMEELQSNMEDNEDAQGAKEEVKLGKLEFSLDYDFSKNEVQSLNFSNNLNQISSKQYNYYFGF